MLSGSSGTASGGAFVSATVVNGHSFPPVPASALEGSVFMTQTDLMQSSTTASPQRGGDVDRSAASPQPTAVAPPPHLRPMSPFEKAGIPLLRSSTPSVGRQNSLDRPRQQPHQQQHLPPRPSSSAAGSLNLPILSKTEDARYEPSLGWFESHYFYAKTSSGLGKSKLNKSGSITSGSFSLGNDGGSSAAFFNQVGTRKITSYVGEHAQAMHEVRQAFDSNACPPNVARICSNLIFKADERGMIAFIDVVSFLVDLVPPPSVGNFVHTCKQFLQAVGGPFILQPAAGEQPPLPPSALALLPASFASAPWLQWRLPFPKLYNTFVAFFVTSLSPIIVRSCFDLCDVTKCGYILKDIFRQFRDEERMSALASFPNAPGVVLPPPGLSYLVVKGAWRVFEKIALEEEEKARNAGGKKGKSKSKKGAAGPVTVPGKRQFHISFKEFASALSEDPHIALSFLPHAIETALALGELPVADPVAVQPIPAE